MILKKIEGERFSEVLPLWAGQTAVIIASGSSLTREQIRHVQLAHADGSVKCIVVNDCYLVASWADVAHAADSHWHRWHTSGIEKPKLGLSSDQVASMWAAFAGQKSTIQSSGGSVEDIGVHIMRNKDFPTHGEGLSLDPRYLVTGRNSGFQAMNLAVLAGAKKVILLGFDGKPGIDGRDHFHGCHPRPTPKEAFPLYRSAMVSSVGALDKAGVKVLNATPDSAIECFERVNLMESLNA